MMAASSRDGSSSFPPPPAADASSSAAADGAFGSFSAAERLSDPFGDVYGAEADFGDFVGGSDGQQQTTAPATTSDSSSLMSFSPLKPPETKTAPPTLLPSISGEVDPFEDITGGMGASVDSGDSAEPKKEEEVDKAPSSATSEILDLVWGKRNSSQETEMNPLSMSSASVNSASGGGSRAASSPSGFSLPPPPSTKFATFPSAGATPEAATRDLLSFSPVRTSMSSDPFFGITNDTTETSAAFGSDELFTLTAAPPLSTTSSSSLRGSFASLHEDVKPPVLSPSTPGSVEVKASPRDPFAERTTRSFGSLSSSFVSVGAMEDTGGQIRGSTPFGAFPAVASEGITPTSVTPSTSSAPPSLRSSFQMTDGFVGFASAADESDEVDPFAEAGLAAPEEVPLAEALAAWNTSADPTVEEDNVDKPTEGADKHELPANTSSDDDLGTESSCEERSDDVLDVIDQKQPSEKEEAVLDVWNSADSTAVIATARNEEYMTDSGITNEHQTAAIPAIESPAVALDSEAIEASAFESFSQSMDPFVNAEGSEKVDDGNARTTDNKVLALGLQDNALDGDKSVSDNEDILASAVGDTVWHVEQNSVNSKKDSVGGDQSNTLFFQSPTVDASLESGDRSMGSRDDVLDGNSAPNYDGFNVSPAISTTSTADKADVDTAVDISQAEVMNGDGADDFGDFGGFEVVAPSTATTAVIPDAAPWGSFPGPTPVQNIQVEDDGDEFGDFAVSASSASADDDGFADFAHTTGAGGDDEFGDFGDFEQSAGNSGDDFTDFQQSSPGAFGTDDDGFDDFAPAIAPTPVVLAPSLSAPSFSKTELSTFFEGAFPTDLLPPSTFGQPESPTDVEDAIQEPSTEFVQDAFRNMWDEYIAIVAATGRQSSSSGSHSSVPEPNYSDEHVRLGGKTARASKYLKYVLTEKIQEASRQNGIFSHGSDRHQMYVSLAASGDAARMRVTLKELQDALFHSSVNDAMMRIAKQAALSAKAKIAEQAAQQQASSRGGSLFSTTRHLLSRGGNAGGAHGPSSSGNDNKADHAGADTPTGASVQKLARYSFTNSQDDSVNGLRGANSNERLSEGSDHTGHSSGSDSEVSAGDSRTRSLPTISSSGSSNGGLMKKFQDRFSFASSRHRPRFVSLRREGQSGEEVRKMELNLDSISGGLDEVKWKCAMFLYDIEEVAHVAPSQISILAYPSKQPLTGKTDRSALTKLVKPDTIWTVDIGANNSDVLNEW